MKTYLNKNDPEYLMVEMSKDFKLRKKGEKPSQTLALMAKKYSFAQNMDNFVLLSEAVSEEYKAYIVEATREIEKEYSIKSPSEKSLVHALVLSYISILQLTSQLNKYLSNSTLLAGSERYCNIISKELDHAYKHFDNSLRLLTQIKSKPINVKINTFQQLNVNDNNKLKV